jgi:hypothetical protein
MLKKFLSLFFVLLLTVGTTSIVFGDNLESSSKTTALKKQTEALEKKVKIMEKIKKNKKYEDDYAGSYIDEEGNLNINFVGEVAEDLKIDKVKYHKVKYSLKHLDSVTTELTDSMVDLGITMIEPNEIDNKVYVYLKNINPEMINKVKKVFNSSAIEFKSQELTIQNTATEIINGNKSYINNSGGYGTIGFAAQKGTKKGIVTHGHGLNVGDVTKYQTSTGSEYGKVTAVKFSGNVDAAFVELNDTLFKTYVPTYKFMNGDTYTSAYVSNSDITVGQSLEAYGGNSGKQYGEVLAKNVSYTVGNTTITNAVKSSYKAIKGDSGAGVRWHRYVGSASTLPHVMGVQSASALGANDDWVSGSYTLFTTVDNIFFHLNLSNP